jgi:hypothetical protein
VERGFEANLKCPEWKTMKKSWNMWNKKAMNFGQDSRVFTQPPRQAAFPLQKV